MALEGYKQDFDIPEETHGAVKKFLDADPARLDKMLSAPDLKELAERRREIIGDAREALAGKREWERALSDQLVRRWDELHPQSE